MEECVCVDGKIANIFFDSVSLLNVSLVNELTLCCHIFSLNETFKTKGENFNLTGKSTLLFAFYQYVFRFF